MGMEAVLQRLSELGYDGFEPAGLGGLSPQRLRELADGLGLRISSAHVELPAGPNAQAVLDEQEALGNRLLISGSRPGQVDSADSVKALADAYNQAAANAKARGMQVGFHNHWWEFEAPAGQPVPYEVLLDRLDPEVFMEVDVYWAAVGGQDVPALLRRLGAKARFLHVKDGPVEPRTPMTAVGRGSLDIDAILEAAPHAEWHVVELDEFDGDMFDAVRDSRSWLMERAAA